MTILVDEMEALRRRREAGGRATGAVGDRGGWQVLGEGRRGSEGFVYLLHPPERKEIDYYLAEEEARGSGKVEKIWGEVGQGKEGGQGKAKGREEGGKGKGKGKERERFGGLGRMLRGL